MESPVNNGMSKTQNDPAVHLYKDAKDTFAAIDSEFPYVATTYRVTEHEHFVTMHVPYLVEAMPDFFVELPVELAEEKGITNGGKVKCGPSGVRSSAPPWSRNGCGRSR